MSERGSIAANFNRRSFAAALAVAAVAILPMGALAQDAFPNRPIELIVHGGPGGGSDLTTTALVTALREATGWETAFVRKQGAGGAVSHQYTMSQPCDGHTVMLLTSSQAATLAQNKSPMKVEQIVGIGRATVESIYLMSSTKGPYKTAQDFLAAAKEKSLTVGVGTVGGGDHISVFLMAKRGELVQPQIVTFQGGGDTAIKLAGGNVDAGMVGVAEAGALIESGDVAPIMVFSAEREAQFPDVPTAKELGIDIVRPTLRGLGVLDCTPPEVVTSLRDGIAKAMQTEGYLTYMKNSGIPMSSIASGEEFQASFKREYDEAVEALTDLGLM